jgi:hypothetical protein
MGSLSIPNLGPYPGTYNPGQYNTGASGPFSASGGYNPFGGVVQGNGSANIEGLYGQLGANYFQQGQQFTTDQSELANTYNSAELGYGGLTNQLYSPIWSGGGGYTPEQMSNIVQSGAYGNIASELPGNQFTSAQDTAITGNPYQAYSSFTSQTPEINNLASQYATGLDEAVAGAGQNADTAITGLQSGLSNSINPTALSLPASYAPTIAGELATGAGALSSAQANPALTPTSQYLTQAGVSDSQVDQLAEQAASGVGAQYQSTEDALKQGAAAAGDATPLALAYAETGLDRSSAASQADAATNATLQAQAAQRTAAQNIQNTQLNAGQYQSGLASSNALAEQNAGIAANTGEAQLGLGAAQALTGYELNAATTGGEAAINEANLVGSNAVNALGAGYNAGNQALEYGASTGAGLESAAESAASGRASGLASNEQATSEYGEGLQNTMANELSGQYVSSYAPWVTQQNMGLTAAQSQEGYYGGQGNTATSQNLQGTGMYMGGTENAAAGLAGRQQVNQQNSFGQQFTNNLGANLGKSLGTVGAGNQNVGFGSEHGSIIDHHQLIEVGEHDRPEMILPLDPRTPPANRNIFEEMGAKLGDQMGIHKRGYETGGITGGNDFTSDLLGLDVAEDPNIIPHYARGGFTMPHIPRIPSPHIHQNAIPLPHVRLTTPSLHLNMPLRMPRISQPIRPAGLPGVGTGYAANPLSSITPPSYEQGGIVNTQSAQLQNVQGRKRNDYRINMGKHNRPMPMPYSEMGSLTGV